MCTQLKEIVYFLISVLTMLALVNEKYMGVELERKIDRVSYRDVLRSQ